MAWNHALDVLRGSFYGHHELYAGVGMFHVVSFLSLVLHVDPLMMERRGYVQQVYESMQARVDVNAQRYMQAMNDGKVFEMMRGYQETHPGFQDRRAKQHEKRQHQQKQKQKKQKQQKKQ
jgi:hypothetical protein